MNIKQISLFIAVFITAILSVSAETFNYSYGGATLKYSTKNDGTCTLYGYESLTSDLTVPANVENRGKYYRVTSIGDGVFFHCAELNSVILPSTVTSIASQAFYSCTNLTSVIIPPSVTSISSSAFIGCTSLKKSAYPSTLNKPFSYGLVVAYNPIGAICEDGVVYGENKTSILFVPYNQTDIIIPDSVTTIGQDAFRGCINLSSVTIPPAVTAIGNSAFAECSNLKKSAYPNVLSNPFTHGLVVAYNPTGAVCDGGIVFGDNKTSILFVPYNLTEVKIPPTVKAIGQDAFRECIYLSSVTIPPSVTTIGNSAFAECTGLKKSAYPQNLTKNPFPYGLAVAYNPSGAVCEDGFIYNQNKSRIMFAPYINGEYVIPNSVTTIGEAAFRDCTALTSIIIPNSVTSIEYNAFRACSGLKEVIIPNSITSIQQEVFGDCVGLTSVTIPNSVKSIGTGAFGACRGLKSITIPNSVTAINSWAFSGCRSLISVIIPSSVTSVGSYAFYDCLELKKAAYPNSLTNPFSNCVAIAYNPKVDVVEDGVIYGADKSSILFASDVLSDDYIIPASVTSIDKYAFSYCSNLRSIDFPNSIISIGNNAFFGCSELSSISIPNSVTAISSSAFISCDGLMEVKSCIKEPFNIGVVFDDVTLSDGILKVPAGSIDKYRAVSQWNQFAQIEEDGNASVFEVEADVEETYMVYNIYGMVLRSNCSYHQLNTLPQGIYILETHNKRIKIKI